MHTYNYHSVTAEYSTGLQHSFDITMSSHRQGNSYALHNSSRTGRICTEAIRGAIEWSTGRGKAELELKMAVSLECSVRGQGATYVQVIEAVVSWGD